jgi:hypothetical protein
MNTDKNTPVSARYFDGWLAASLEPEVIEQLCRDRFEIFGEMVWKKFN